MKNQTMALTADNNNMSEIEKVIAIPMNFDIAMDTLKSTYSTFRKSGVYMAVAINHAIDSLIRQGQLKNVSEVLKSETWRAKFDLPIEDRMVRLYNRTGKLASQFLKQGIELPISKIEQFATILEKKEYKKVIENNAKDIALLINDQTIDASKLENKCIDLFMTLEKPTADSPMTEILDYQRAVVEIPKTLERLKKVETPKVKELTRSFTIESITIMLKSCGIDDTTINKVIKEYFQA